MAIRRILLLSGQTEAPFLTVTLRAHNPALEVDSITTTAALETASQGPLDGTRLVSFCSPVIVPGPLLARLPGPSYNFHPGPPEYPGRYPSVFALYDGAPRFGITVHEMAAKVDAGGIIAAEWFEVLPTDDLATLDERTFAVLTEKFRTMAVHLATLERPMTRMPYRWGHRKTKMSDRDALCRITPDLDPAEVARRQRACGQN